MPRNTASVEKVSKAKSQETSPTEKIIPLTGKALKLKLKELSHLSKSETAKGWILLHRQIWQGQSESY